MKDKVLQAIKDAFLTDQIEPNLDESGGRVYGTVKVVGSGTFDNLNDTRRQHLMWQKLIEILGSESTSVGPVVLEPTKRG